MTLARLAQQLHNVRSTYLIGLTALHVLCDDRATNSVRNESATFGDKQIRFASVVNLITSKEYGDKARNEFGKAVLREVVVGVRAVIFRAIAEGTDLDLEGAAWWSVARLVGATLWNGGAMYEGCEELSLLPIHWRGRTFDEDGMMGDLTVKKFGYADGFWLAEDANAHVERLVAAEAKLGASKIDFAKLFRGGS